MEERELQAVLEGYMKAFEERELAQCVDCFAEDAVLHFGRAALGLGRFQGKAEIEEWHKNRFAADARIIKVEDIEVKDNKVYVRCAVTSSRLQAYMINNIRGSGTFTFEQGKIKELHLGLISGFRLHN